MNEDQILSLIQQAIEKKVASGGSFVELYPFAVVGLLGYLLGKLSLIHHELRAFFSDARNYFSRNRL